jgi:hypothetical protein
VECHRDQNVSVCVVEWVRSRAVMLHCTEFDGSRVRIPGADTVNLLGADTVNQAIHPSGVGKLVAISIQWVTAVEDCEV